MLQMNCLVLLTIAAALEIAPSGDAFLRPLEKRDSVLVADQLHYGVKLEGLKEGTGLALPDFAKASNDTLTIIGEWKLDTVSNGRKVHSRNAKAAAKVLQRPFDLEASITLAPFEEGIYELPDIPVVLARDGKMDTLIFKGLQMDVKSMPVDTASFVPHDLKEQIKYPVTFAEVLPWAGGALGAAALAALALWLLRRAASRRRDDGKPKEPAYITALRELEKYRSEKFWAPEKQKGFYSGITDTLKTYIDERFSVDAPEMTTAELFDAIKGNREITPEMYVSLKELFERADFVKFAKFTASDEDNAKALPLAVSFVTSTIPQTSGEEDDEGGEEAAAKA